VADLGSDGGGPPPPPPFEKNVRFFPAKTNEKLIHTTSNEPQKVVFAHNRPPPLKKS